MHGNLIHKINNYHLCYKIAIKMPIKWQGDHYLCFQDVFYKYLQVLWVPWYPTVKRYKIHTSGLTLSWLIVSMQILVEQSNNFQSNMLKFSRKLSIHTDTSFFTDSLLCPWGMKALFSKFKPLNTDNLLIKTLFIHILFQFFFQEHSLTVFDIHFSWARDHSVNVKKVYSW